MTTGSFHSAINAGLKTIQQAAGVDVEYLHDSQTFDVVAVVGDVEVDVVDESGLSVRSRVWDFIIRASDLGFDPVAGDVITWNGRRHEVMNLGGDGVWRWSDPARTYYRIHTKDIGVAL